MNPLLFEMIDDPRTAPDHNAETIEELLSFLSPTEADSIGGPLD